jgi:hypothetical protein
MKRVSVTKREGSICRRACPCGRPLPAGARSSRRYCSDGCRVEANRRKTGRHKKPAPPLRKTKLPVDYEKDLLYLTHHDWYGGIVEIWHHRFGRGVLDLSRYFADSSDGRAARCATIHVFFNRKRSIGRNVKHTEYLPWAEVFCTHWWQELPKHLLWVTKQDLREREQRLVQLFDSDRNSDLGADSAKWDRDGGFAPEAEVAVEQILDKGHRLESATTGGDGDDDKAESGADISDIADTPPLPEFGARDIQYISKEDQCNDRSSAYESPDGPTEESESTRRPRRKIEPRE